MRTIKFRGRTLKDDGWVQGALLPDLDGKYYIQQNGNQEIDPDTICQFTGMKDRFGNEIYEGDIVTWLPTILDGALHTEQGVVRVSEMDFVVVNRVRAEDGGESIHRLIWCTRNLTVIGNRYDNPELME